MTAWHELVVEGAERTLRAFVAGFLAGRGEHAGGVFGSDIALAAGSFGERLKALFAAAPIRSSWRPNRSPCRSRGRSASAAGSWGSSSSATGWPNRRNSRFERRHFRVTWQR